MSVNLNKQQPTIKTSSPTQSSSQTLASSIQTSSGKMVRQAHDNICNSLQASHPPSGEVLAQFTTSLSSGKLSEAASSGLGLVAQSYFDADSSVVADNIQTLFTKGFSAESLNDIGFNVATHVAKNALDGVLESNLGVNTDDIQNLFSIATDAFKAGGFSVTWS